MAQTERTSNSQIALNKARILSIWWIFAPFKDFAARIAQALWWTYWSKLTRDDQAAIDQFYESRRQIFNIAPDITQAGVIWTSAANETTISKNESLSTISQHWTSAANDEKVSIAA